MADNAVTWQCAVENMASNFWTVIVLDPDLPNNVILSRVKFRHDNDALVLVCTTSCENKFNFSWDIDGNISDTTYDSCKHICSQTLTLDSREKYIDEQIACRVTNTWTGKTSSTQYLITSDNSWTTAGQGSGLPTYIWGVASYRHNHHHHHRHRCMQETVFISWAKSCSFKLIINTYSSNSEQCSVRGSRSRVELLQRATWKSRTRIRGFGKQGSRRISYSGCSRTY